MECGVRGDGSREAPLMQRMLSEKAEEISVGIARRLTDKTVGLHRVMMLLTPGDGVWSVLRNGGYT